jgi:adenine-specific DNA-methyltransferase
MTPHLIGLTGMREYPRSRYCQRKYARDVLSDLVQVARAGHILISYNDEGVLSLEDIREILSLRGTPKTFQTNYNRFKADNGRRYKRDSTIEYVHYVGAIKPQR